METKPLAVVGKIISINPIDGADRIRSATVVCGSAGKWTGVVGLDYSEGDVVTVFLQDAKGCRRHCNFLSLRNLVVQGNQSSVQRMSL